MNIFVFVKRVPDTESKIRINPTSTNIVFDGLNYILNPYDEYAVEEALRIKESQGGQVTVFSVGPDEAQAILKKCLAMGADEAVLIKDESEELYDGWRTARIIVAALQQHYPGFDLLLFGKQAVGDDNSQVPAMVAEMLGLPQVNVVTKLEIQGSQGVAYREIEGAHEKVVFSLPAVISAQKGLNEPRYETLRGIMAAKRRQIPVLPLEQLGLTEEEIKPKVAVVKVEAPPPRKAGQVIDEEITEAVKKLVAFLHEEAKVI